VVVLGKPVAARLAWDVMLVKPDKLRDHGE